MRTYEIFDNDDNTKLIKKLSEMNKIISSIIKTLKNDSDNLEFKRTLNIKDGYGHSVRLLDSLSVGESFICSEGKEMRQIFGNARRTGIFIRRKRITNDYPRKYILTKAGYKKYRTDY